MKKDNIEIIKITLVLLLFIGTLLLIYLFKNKYDEVEILSIKQEYNIVYTNNSDYINIPLYFKRNDSYLSKYEEIDSVSLSSSDTFFKASLDSVTKGSETKYKDETYYEFIFSLSFPMYDDFNSPIYLKDCLFNIQYKNNNTISFEIGNVNILFNSSINQNNDLIIYYLNSVTNDVNNKLTIVGINLTIYNNKEENIYLNNIKINNDYYELDYLNYSTNLKDSKENLSLNKNYNYLVKSFMDGDMDYKIEPKEKVDIFIPLKYKSEIKIINNIPLYITYNNDKLYIQDDFTFFKRIDSINTYEVSSYVYKY